MVASAACRRLPPRLLPHPSSPGRPFTRDYAGFVDLSREIVRGRTSAQQRATVGAVLASLLPPGGPARFRALFPFNRFSAEANAAFTKIGFGWLVGPMATSEVEVVDPETGAVETWCDRRGGGVV